MPKGSQVAGSFGEAQDPPNRRTFRIIWISVAILASALSFALSWPWWRDYSYWAESHTMWAIYFITGFLLAVYVFYVFFGVTRTLFEHDKIERAEIEANAAADQASNSAEGRP